MDKKYKWIAGIVAVVVVVGALAFTFQGEQGTGYGFRKFNSSRVKIPTVKNIRQLKLSPDYLVSNITVGNSQGFSDKYIRELAVTVDNAGGNVECINSGSNFISLTVNGDILIPLQEGHDRDFRIINGIQSNIRDPLLRLCNLNNTSEVIKIHMPLTFGISEQAGYLEKVRARNCNTTAKRYFTIIIA
jgi:hypothetical protein